MNFKETKKKLKKDMKKIIKYVAESLKGYRISTKNIGIIIRSFHICVPCFFYIILFFGNFFVCTIIFLISIFGFIAFYTFDCCFLSLLEKELCEDNFIVVDPGLELIGLEINSENRYLFTKYGCPLYIITIFCIYYLRFIKK